METQSVVLVGSYKVGGEVSDSVLPRRLIWRQFARTRS
jgi:hypothetical protein